MNYSDPNPHHLDSVHDEMAAPTIYEAPKRIGYWRRMGAGSLGVSLLIHGILLLAAILWLLPALQNGEREEIPFIPKGGGGDGAERKTEARVRLNFVRNQEHARVSTTKERTEVVIPSSTVTFDMPSVVKGSAASKDGLGGPLGPGPMGPGGPDGGPKMKIFVPKPPDVFRSRCSAAERQRKLAANGGDSRCEAAVQKGLAWIQSQQNPDGSWGRTHQGAMTGLALLAFYGHCETPDSAVYGKNVMNGLSYLVELGRRNNGFFSTRLGSSSCVYDHGIATYALGETYSFSKFGSMQLPGVRESFEKGVGIIIAHQTGEGGWSYGGGSPHYVVSGRNDLSVTGWQFQALKAAKHTGLRVGGLDGALKKCESYLESTQKPSGGFGEEGNGSYSVNTMTGIGCLGLQTIGHGSNAKADKGLKFLLNKLDEEPLDWGKNADLYCWYYYTQAFFQKGGDSWKVWNREFQDQLLKHQNPDGSWHQETGQHGAATTSAAGEDAGIYRASLCVLMLEVYYRYLKVGDRQDGGFTVR